MKREEIHVMEAGEDLDDLVHVHVMGACLHKEGFESVEGEHDPEGPLLKCKTCDKRAILGRGMNAVIVWPSPEYSTDIAQAWKVVEALRARRRDLVLNDGTNHFPPMYEVQAGIDAHGPWTFCWFGLEGGVDGRCARAATAPLAICRAALLTTLSEEEYAEGRRWPDGMRVQDGKLVQA